MRSGFAQPESGEEPWLIKFDGVSADAAGQGMRAVRDPGPWGRIEYAYSCMARDAGIEMPETHLLRDGKFAHFMTRRFDRVSPDATGSAGRLHFHSLGGVQHIDFNDQFVFSSGFLMSREGCWRLAPAYDVTYAENEAWTRQHQISVNGKFREITRDDLLQVGEMYDVPDDGREIVAEVAQVLSGWRDYATEAAVPDGMAVGLEGRLGIHG